MTKTQCFVLGLVLAAIGAAAMLQIIHIDHVMRVVSIAAVGVSAVIAALVFFACAFRD